jgi:hypothetical protein
MNYKKLVKDIILEIAVDRRLRLYGFDWDDNILEMPTKIYLKSDEGSVVGMSTEDFANYRSQIGSKPFKYKKHIIVGFDDDAFRDFRRPDTFLRDTKKAILKNKTAPSFKKFKENLIYANPFSIITARGHDPKVIRKGVRMFVDYVFEPEEKEKMVKNIISTFKHEELFSKDFITKLNRLNQDQLIDLYLDEKGDYYPVSSEEFGEKFGLDTSGGAANPEHAKKVALLDFVNKYDELIRSGKYVSASLGFSDDDPRNVKAMVEFIQDELSKMYPDIKFRVYDTSEGGYKQIKIETENNQENKNEDELMLESVINRIIFKIKSK